MDEFEQVAQELANLELQAKDIVRQMAKNLCVDLVVTEECEPEQLVSPTDLQRRGVITNSAAPPVSLEARIGRLECTVDRIVTPINPSEIRSDSGLPSDLGESVSIGHLLTGVAGQLKRIADHFNPPPPDLVGSTYVADRLGCTTVWVAEMARRGIIPTSCVVQGTGNGKPWKFLRIRIDEWLKRR